MNAVRSRRRRFCRKILPAVAAALILVWRPAASVNDPVKSAQDKPKTRSVSVKGMSFELVTIPAGDFLMGSATGDGIERPVHHAQVKSFELARTEVTVKLFRAFTEATQYKTQAEKNNSSWLRDLDALEKGGRPWRLAPIHWRAPGFPQSEDDPAVCVSWDDAMAFCEWLSKEAGEPFRLPVEAEWEYSCRAGTTGDYAGNLEEVAWYRENSNRKTHPVGRKKANAWGLYDMHGNAWEWCSDVWRPYEGAAAKDLPSWIKEKKVDFSLLHPLRGGAWGLDKVDYRSGDLRASSRVPYPHDQSCNNSGFRVAGAILGDNK